MYKKLSKDTRDVAQGVVVLVALVVISYIAGYFHGPVDAHALDTTPKIVQQINIPGRIFNPRDATYTIDGQQVQLDNFIKKDTASVATSVKYFGNEVRVDLNKDGKEDVVFLITEQTGGSGTFYYVVAAIKSNDTYLGSHAYFLGDRIAPQATMVNKDGSIEVSYADRDIHESYATPPSYAKSVKLVFDAKAMTFLVKK
jgi:hypothetical protein